MQRYFMPLSVLLVAIPCSAQTGVDRDPQLIAPEPTSSTMATTTTRAGNPASVGNDQVGQRQTRDQAAPSIQPAGRIDGRIQNRVQNRIRNRIDRSYNPQANATSPFSVASDQARTSRR